MHGRTYNIMQPDSTPTNSRLIVCVKSWIQFWCNTWTGLISYGQKVMNSIHPSQSIAWQVCEQNVLTFLHHDMSSYNAISITGNTMAITFQGIDISLKYLLENIFQDNGSSLEDRCCYFWWTLSFFMWFYKS